MGITSSPFEIVQEVQYRDLDTQQHVNNIAYFIYFENIRMAFAKHINGGKLLENVVA